MPFAFTHAHTSAYIYTKSRNHFFIISKRKRKKIETEK